MPIVIPWYKTRTPKMAFAAWLQQQDRSGLDIGPVFDVPPTATGITARLASSGYLNPAQRVDFAFEASFDGGNNYEDYGSTAFTGGDVGVDNDGNPNPREFGIGFAPTRRPTQMRVRLTIPGSLNCGLVVQFEGVA